MPSKWKIGTFNLFNLVLPEVPYYGDSIYTREEYQRKIRWVAGQLRSMEADVVGFQEVFHEAALREALHEAGGEYAEAEVHVAAGDEGVEICRYTA